MRMVSPSFPSNLYIQAAAQKLTSMPALLEAASETHGYVLVSGPFLHSGKELTLDQSDPAADQTAAIDWLFGLLDHANDLRILRRDVRLADRGAGTSPVTMDWIFSMQLQGACRNRGRRLLQSTKTVHLDTSCMSLQALLLQAPALQSLHLTCRDDPQYPTPRARLTSLTAPPHLLKVTIQESHSRENCALALLLKMHPGIEEFESNRWPFREAISRFSTTIRSITLRIRNEELKYGYSTRPNRFQSLAMLQTLTLLLPANGPTNPNPEFWEIDILPPSLTHLTILMDERFRISREAIEIFATSHQGIVELHLCGIPTHRARNDLGLPLNVLIPLALELHCLEQLSLVVHGVENLSHPGEAFRALQRLNVGWIGFDEGLTGNVSAFLKAVTTTRPLVIRARPDAAVLEGYVANAQLTHSWYGVEKLVNM